MLWCPKHPLRSPLGHVLWGSMAPLPWIMTHKVSLSRSLDLSVAWLSTKTPNIFLEYAPGNSSYPHYGEKPYLWPLTQLHSPRILVNSQSVAFYFCKSPWTQRESSPFNWSDPVLFQVSAPTVQRKTNGMMREAEGMGGFIFSLWMYCESDC